MATTIDIGTLITRSPDVKGGRPRISGTGITVNRIVGWYRIGWSPEKITEQLAHLSLAQVHAALAYYYANKEDVDADIKQEDAEEEQIESEHLKKNRP